MYWAPLAAEAVLLGALLPSVNAAVAPRYEEAREEHVRRYPEPTANAILDLSNQVKGLHARDVMRRQAATTSTTFTITMAPDETCGYLSASAGVGITCENGQTCAWEVEQVDVILCGTQIKNQCLESSVAVDTALCNDVCQSNEFNLLCTDSDTPYCRTYIYPSGVWDYRCASTPVESPQSVDFTYDGESDPGFITTVLDETTSIIPSTSVAVPTVASTTTSDEAASSTTTAPAETTTSPKKKTPVGAIVGGVVGGVAVIAFIVFGILFFLRRKKSQTPPAAAPPAQQQPPANYVPGPTDQYQQQMLQHQQMQMAMGGDAKPVMVSSPVPSDWRNSTMSGPSTAVSPVSQGGWVPQPFPNNNVSPPPAPAPAYEAPGHEAREPTPVYEMGDDNSGAKR